ncbi:MAG: 30S ribosomal protein S1 [Thermogutta sp.]|uniref:30S ribosomal protein S1 n=1 Tax=Thermogutta sp. TaxID=1962930 RepID=UPI0019A767D9|nr:30S ribosomal protein S1 [Thermogutta sp.]MBC7351849.1 30S ribosomal protein S1 [Thermogutta sp.]
MVNRNLIRQVEVTPEELEAAYGGMDPEALALAASEIAVNQIVEGRILRVEKDFVVVDVGSKSEGIVPLSEWTENEEPPKPGQTVSVLVEELEDMYGLGDEYRGMITLSKRKAEKIRAWMRVMETVKEGDVVTGIVTRKIKGGLLVDIGVNVFLPASQVDIRRPADIGEFIGRTVQCLVLKIDESRRNIVVSRRALIEQERAEKKAQLLAELEVGQRRKGVVKNIADFGVFVDLGGIDGLLHITDMSWGRINHPSEMVSIDEEIEVVILDVNREKEKIALGLKQKTPSPWEDIELRYPVGSRVKGTVVNVMNYGAFVKLEEGVEGLVHISEMSWTRRINHPSEVVQVGDEVEVVVLGIDKEKQEISLGIKQTMQNPWENVEERYPVGSVVKGIVRNITNYGAFVELEEGVDGLLHVSDLSWTRKITHPSEVLQKGQEIECRVLSVDKNRRRIALGLKQLTEDPWETYIPSKYQPGQIVKGTVTKITNFGVFVGLEDGLEGLLHISELADHKVDNPEEIVKVGDEIEVKILRVDKDERKIGLSRKRVEWAEEEQQAAAEPAPEPKKEKEREKEKELKGGLGGSGGPLIQGLTGDRESESAG